MNDATQARNAARDGRRDERDAAATRYASRRARCHTEASRDEEDHGASTTLLADIFPAQVQAYADNHGQPPDDGDAEAPSTY